MKAEFAPRHNPPRSVTYGRVSSPDQAKQGKESLPWQTAEATRYASEQGWEVVGQFEEAVTGRKIDRPEFSKIMDLARRGEIDYVVLALLSREARNFAVSAILRAQLTQYGVQVVYVDADTSTKEGQRLTDIRRLFYEWERDEIEERLARGRLIAFQKGNVQGSGTDPYGWRYVRGKERTYEQVPEEAEILKGIYVWLADEGISMNAACRRLMAMGVKPRKSKVWNGSTISYMIRNPMNKGTFYYYKTQAVEPTNPRTTGPRAKDNTSKTARPQDEWIAFPVEPIVPEDLWQRAVDAIERNRNHLRREARMQYLLKGGHIVCDLCGNVMCGMTQKRVHGHCSYYRCQGASIHRRTQGKPLCRSKYLRADRVEVDAWARVLELLTDPNIPRRIIEESSMAEDAIRDRTTLLSIAEHERSINEQLDLLVDLYTTRGIDRERYDQKRAYWEHELEQVRAEKGTIEERVLARERAEADVAALQAMSVLYKGLEPDPPIEIKRRILKTLKVQVHSVGDGTYYVRGFLDSEIFRIAAEYMDGHFHFDGATPEDHETLRYWFGLYVDKFSEAHGILGESYPKAGSINGGQEETVYYSAAPEGLPRPAARHHVRAPARHGHAAGHIRDARLRAPGDPFPGIPRHVRG